jgi:hypothetical protein
MVLAIFHGLILKAVAEMVLKCFLMACREFEEDSLQSKPIWIEAFLNKGERNCDELNLGRQSFIGS